jgi:hypothetical protein
MRRIYINALLGGDVHPPVANPAARENERNVIVSHIQNGEF